MIEDVLIYKDQIYVIYEDGGGQWLPRTALENGTIRWKPIGIDIRGEKWEK